MKNIKEEIVDELFIKRNVKIMNKDRLIFFFTYSSSEGKKTFSHYGIPSLKKKKRKKKVLVTMDNNFTRY